MRVLKGPLLLQDYGPSMSDTKETDSPSGGKRTLALKRTEHAGHVQQSFSHGRKNSVVVEKKKRRVITAPATDAAAPKAPVVETKKKRRPADAKPSGGRGKKDDAGSLSAREMEARFKALEEARARKAEDEAKRAAEEQALREKDERRREERAERTRREAEEKAAADARAAKKKQEEERAKAAAKAAKAPVADPSAPDPATRAKPSDSARRSDARPGGAAAKKSKPEQRPTKREGRQVKGRLTINNALDQGQRERSLASLRRRQQKEKNKGAEGPREKISREVIVPEVITIQELSQRMSERGVDVIKYLMQQGEMHKINDVIDVDTAVLIVEEFGHTAKRVSESDVEDGFIGEEDIEENQVPRAPIVTIMGHVDHGKTSLLDALRDANVVSGEAGGITQHIGAYQVKTPGGELVTFIDTPGHAAFTAMRARGAKVTDIVVLVVAADDGVMPQTIEAINHAQAAEVPMIVAINKMDLPAADPTRVRTELLQHNVVVESMSGDTLEVEVSALKKEGLDSLLQAIALQAELQELKADDQRNGEGVVVEAKLERGRGPVGTLLIQRGKLEVGDIVVAGSAWGKVRALINHRGEQVAKAGPSEPVEVLGFNSAPEAGDQFAVVDSEARAREITEYRERKRREMSGAASVLSLEQMMSQLQTSEKSEFPLLIKADVQGSVEAIQSALEKLGNDEVGARVIHGGVGGITESDIGLAQASQAVVLAFNTRPNKQAKMAAERDGVEIRQYAVIYDLIDDVKSAMSGMLAPTKREHFLGNAEILEVFNISKVGKVAGCRVTEGKVERGAAVRLIRDGVVIHEGKLSTLKRFKDEVKEVQGGQECGMAFEKYEDMRVGDVIECFTIEMVSRTLDDVEKEAAAAS